MKTVFASLLLLVVACTAMNCGCGQSPPNPYYQQGEKGGYLYFNPHLNLKMPGDWGSGGSVVTIDESNLVWGARGWSKLNGTEMVLEAQVTEFCAADLRGKTDQEVLESPLRESSLLSGTGVLEHGPNKYPELRVTSQSADKKYVRLRIVYAKPTLYVVSVTSPVREWLDSTEAVEFLDSLRVTSSDTALNREECFPN